MAGRVGAERGEAIAVLFDKVWHERKGLKGARKLLDATMRTAEGRELKPTLKDAETWVETNRVARSTSALSRNGQEQRRWVARTIRYSA